jgi:hypothetical protein
MKMTRGTLIQALKVAQSMETEFAVTVGLTELSDRGLGQISRKRYRIDRLERKALRNWLESEGIAWTTPMSALNCDRLGTALVTVNEKVGLRPKAPQRVWLAAIGHGVTLNGSDLPVIEGAFISMSMGMIHEIRAEHLLLVENKAAFEGLHHVAGTFDRRGVLAVYRGDPETPYGQRWACDTAESFGIPLSAYMDCDPAGIAMGVSSGATQLLLPAPAELAQLQGSTVDFRNQYIGWESVKKRATSTDPLAPWVCLLNERKAGFTQERLIAHRVRHQWVRLHGEERGAD